MGSSALPVPTYIPAAGDIGQAGTVFLSKKCARSRLTLQFDFGPEGTVLSAQAAGREKRIYDRSAL
jgi:hypothetical protein